VTGIKNQSGSSEDFIKTVIKDYNFYTQNMWCEVWRTRYEVRSEKIGSF
jgi:hypothetical protein